MFQTGNTVLHPGEGVCRVEDIRTEEFQKGQPRDYYLLRPVAGGGMTVYLPVDQQRVQLRAVMTPAQARTLREDAEAQGSVWIDNDRERQARFAKILRAAQPIELMRMVLDIRAEQKARRQSGKKLRFTDEHALQDAVRLLRQEIAAVLEITPDDVTL